MQSHRKLSTAGRQRGSTNWAFIIALILLLVFVWMWYDETDKQDKMTQDLAAAKAKNVALNADAVRAIEELKAISSAVGWEYKNFPLKTISYAETSIPITEANLVRQHFKPDGVVPGAEDGQTVDGIMKRLLAAAQLNFEREARLHTTKTGEEKPHTFKTLSSAFKEKLASVRAKWAEIQFSRPASPADPDDEQGKADYNSELKDWENKVAEYNADLQALSEMEGWTEYTARIAAPGTWGDIQKEGVTVHFFTYTDTGKQTVEAGLVGLDDAFKRMAAELKANMAGWAQEVTQLRKDTAAKDVELAKRQTALETEQTARTNDVNQLTERVNAETERANRNAIRATTAENESAKTKEDATKVETGLKREIEARKEQNRLLKEKQDLVIARNDDDGKVLVANNTLGTAMIDLGHKDKAFVGQKFGVSGHDRNGHRVMKGEILVVRVTGDHSAKCRILSGTVGGGDDIHNPFYEKGATIYVYFAAKLDKWPKAMAAERLAKLGVVVQDAPNGQTQYIIVPNSWAAPAEAPSEDDEEEETAAASPLEDIQKTARIFGANVITENILDAFLNY